MPIVRRVVRLRDALGAALDRRAICVVGVGHRERDVPHAVAMARVVLQIVLAGPARRSARSGSGPAAARRDPVAHTGLKPRVGDLLEAKRVSVEVRGLRGIADPQLDVVNAVERHEVLTCGLGRHDGLRAHGSSLEVVLAFS